MDTINYTLLEQQQKDQGAKPETELYAIINNDRPDAKTHDDYIELHHNDQKLEMMAKLMAEEIVTESSSEWPGFEFTENKCLYILPLGSLDIIKQWAIDYPDSTTHTL